MRKSRRDVCCCTYSSACLLDMEKYGTASVRHQLDVFHQRSIQTIMVMGISWCDHLANDEVLRRVMLLPLSDIVRVRRLNLAGQCLPKGKAGKCSHELGTCLW